MLDTLSILNQQQEQQQKKQTPNYRMPLPIIRRKRAHLSSTRIDQVEAQGLAHLCFAEDHSWFQGNIHTEDESNYSLFGERVTPPIPIEQNNNEVKPEDQQVSKSSEYYRVTLIDHFTGLSHTLPKIVVNQNVIEDDSSNASMFCCADDGQMCFKVENIFKGQKADMIIQRHLGSSTLLGKRCLVYSGAMNIVFQEVIDIGRSWCL